MKPLTSIFRVRTTSAAKEKRQAPLHLEKRSHPRIPVLSGDLPGLVRLHGTSTFLEAGAVNVSDGGLCLWLSSPVLPNAQLDLVIDGGESIPLVVVYCRPSVEHPGERWMCGLKLPAKRVENLVEVFLRGGCIVDAAP